MTMPVDTSEMVVKDLSQAIERWAQCEDSRSDAWEMRQIALLQAMIPVCLYLERCAHGMPPQSMLDLARLEVELEKNANEHGLKFSLIASQLQKNIENLPGYLPHMGVSGSPAAIQLFAKLTSTMRYLNAGALMMTTRA